MPVMPCVKDGKSGWKWGESGFCYTDGQDAENKQKAIRQGLAIGDGTLEEEKKIRIFNE